MLKRMIKNAIPFGLVDYYSKGYFKYFKNKQKWLKQFRTKKILLISHEMSLTGAPNSLLRMAKLLREKYYIEVWSKKDGIFSSSFFRNGFKVKIINFKDFKSVNLKRDISLFDLVICNTIDCYYEYSICSKFAKTVWFIRESREMILWNDPLCISVMKNSKDLVSTSEMCDYYIKKYYENKSFILHNAVEDYFENVNIKPAKKNCNDRLKILSIGCFDKRKNFDFVLNAILLLPLKYRNQIEYQIIGDTIFSKYCINCFDKYSKYSFFKYLGPIENIEIKNSFIKNSDVICVPSKSESCSLVALEGAMMGKPLLLSKAVGAKYLINGNGWLFSPNKTKSFQRIIIDILDKKYNLKEFGRISRKNYLADASIEQYKIKLFKLIKEYMK